MKKKDIESGTFDELRRRAESWLGGNRDYLLAGERNPAADTIDSFTNCMCTKIELEMQNEELQRVQAELEQGLARFTDLYEFAPVGYMTLDSQGVLLEINSPGQGYWGKSACVWLGGGSRSFLPSRSVPPSTLS